MTVKTRLGLECNIQKSNVHINGIHGNVMKTYGTLTTKFTYKGETRDITFQVMNGKKDLELLGRADIARLGFVIRVNATKQTCHAKQLWINTKVLGSSIGCKPGEYDIKIDDTVTWCALTMLCSICPQAESERWTCPSGKMWHYHKDLQTDLVGK